ncbi:hypothetical protein M758_1G107500 [Ceratodon purpureus]|uniref:Uncharacterized protein n=1 Tax=Ceratodon purpureus TaxID=3225 RepID=A0A8T0J3C2_CERPU|nr:hypothetical protein KC19_1G099400 [Ceratodon purpureus]KAG0629483.1 hypothetical protein M758_1G107500 [Ceratodon purpureus]
MVKAFVSRFAGLIQSLVYDNLAGIRANSRFLVSLLKKRPGLFHTSCCVLRSGTCRTSCSWQRTPRTFLYSWGRLVSEGHFTRILHCSLMLYSYSAFGIYN